MIKTTTQSGFSLVETLVAITILLIVIVGPMSISSQSAQSTSFSSEQVIAFFLAQEGAELIQKERDGYFNEALESQDPTATPWADFKNNSAVYPGCLARTVQGQVRGCGVEVVRDSQGTIAVTQCTGGPCKLLLDPSTNNTFRARYTHRSMTGNPGLEDTPYSREIVIEPVSGTPNEIKVTSTVYWRSGNVREEQSASVTTYLFNTYGE